MLSIRFAIVAPLAGAWIEIAWPLSSSVRPTQSLPLRERGLKFDQTRHKMLVHPVAPLAGAWIEICLAAPINHSCFVAPLAGAWIEISPAP